MNPSIRRRTVIAGSVTLFACTIALGFQNCAGFGTPDARLGGTAQSSSGNSQFTDFPSTDFIPVTNSSSSASSGSGGEASNASNSSTVGLNLGSVPVSTPVAPQFKYRVAMVGDSITWGAGDPSKSIGGLWPQLLGLKEGEVVNLGISGNRTIDVLARMDSIVAAKPELLFLLIGVNDLNSRRSIAEALQGYRDILNAFRGRLPNTKIYLQSVLPVDEQRIHAPPYSLPTTNADIITLNSGIESLAREYSYAFLKIRTVFEMPGGFMRAEMSSDGLHLSGAGYGVWSAYLRRSAPELGSRIVAGCSVLEPVCEGTDFVRRDACGREIDRWTFAPYCDQVRCEGTDFVRRNSAGAEIDRWRNAPTPYCP